MKKALNLLALSAYVLAAVSCQKNDNMNINPDAPEPVIGEITLTGTPLVYGGVVTCQVDISDPNVLSHAEIALTINNSEIFSKTIPAENSEELSISEEISIPFGAMCADVTGKVVVKAMNKELKTSEKSADITIRRPDLGTLKFVQEGKSYADGIALSKSEDGDVYTASVTLENGVTGFIKNGDGEDAFVWGFDEGSSVCELGNETPITLYDSENSEGVTSITFDALTFEVLPLKKEMTVGGVSFVKYKKNPSDENFVDNTYIAQGVSLKKGQEVPVELIDLAEILFDENYFSQTDGKLVYTGEDGVVNLYLNQLYNFVFVEPSDKPFVSSAAYPDAIFMNGWGAGVPELWYFHPNWDFNSAPSIYKVSETETGYVYSGTMCFQADATFKFYTGKDWGYEIKPNEMEMDNDIFEVKEEDGKPGNYNIYMKDKTFKSSVIAIRITRSKDSGSTSLSAELIRTSDSDK